MLSLSQGPAIAVIVVVIVVVAAAVAVAVAAAVVVAVVVAVLAVAIVVAASPVASLPEALLLLLPATSLLSPAGVPLQSLPEYGCCLYSKFHCSHNWKPSRYPCQNSNCYLYRKTNLVK